METIRSFRVSGRFGANCVMRSKKTSAPPKTACGNTSYAASSKPDGKSRGGSEWYNTERPHQSPGYLGSREYRADNAREVACFFGGHYRQTIVDGAER